MFKNKSFGAILLIAGTCIGAGMLALPVSSAPSGFLPSVGLLTVCWFFMYVTGLYVLEVNIALPNTPSYISMAHVTLGKTGEIITWLGFLLLLYALLAAYVTGAGDMLQEASLVFLPTALPQWLGSLLWVFAFSVLIYFGVKTADYINRLFMLGLIVAYALLMTIASSHVNFHGLMTNGHNQYLMAALPVVFTGLGYHIIVPTVCRYLDRDAKAIHSAILWGSLIPFITYVAWEAVVFGVIPLTGEQGLIAILRSGHGATGIEQSLHHILQNPWVTTGARFFIFFAIASSFLGVSFGLFDLIADGSKIKKTHMGRLVLLLLTFVPPLIFTFLYPKGFILALSYAGIFVAIIHGLLPAVMAWSERNKSMETAYRVAGGKFLLVLVCIFFLIVIYFDIAADFGWIPTINANYG